MQKKGNNNRKWILLCASVMVLLAILIATQVFMNRTDDTGFNVIIDPTYAALNISWDEQSGSDGYYIYAADRKDYELIGEAEGAESCSFAFSGYEHDHVYKIRVASYKKNVISGEKTENNMSEPVRAEYDSSKYAQKIPVLTYHKIVPNGTEFTISILIAEETFDKQMKYLHDNGFTTITPDEFYEWHEGRKEFPVKTCMVTFDDGFYGVYHLAYPIIKKYGQAATVFCIGKHIGETTAPFDPDEREDHYIGWDAIESVREEYPDFAFESHTFDMHRRRKGKKPAEAYTYEQIKDDCELMEPFGFRYLAYPWGTYSDTMQQALRDSGYKMAFTYNPFYYAKRTDDILAVNRIRVSGKIKMRDFIRIVNGKAKKYDLPE